MKSDGKNHCANPPVAGDDSTKIALPSDKQKGLIIFQYRLSSVKRHTFTIIIIKTNI